MMRSSGISTESGTAATPRIRHEEIVRQRAGILVRIEVLVVALAVTVFLALAMYQYRLPGLYYDEAADVVPAMQLLKGQEVNLQRGVGIHLFGRDFPVMIGDYWGTTSTYAVLPLFAVFGIDVLPIRLFPIAASAVAVVLTYLLGRRLFDARIGAMAALLLSVSPTFVFWSRVGIYVIAHIVAITLGVMLAYLSWRACPRRWKLVVGAFLAGVGLTTKLLFVWFFIAVPVAYAALLVYDWFAVADRRRAGLDARSFVSRHIRCYLPLRSAGDALVLAAAFGVGAFPVLYYNLVSRGSYYLLRANLGSTERGVNNFAILDNLGTQFRELRIFLDGGYFWFLGGVFTNPIATPFVGLSTLGLLLLTALPEYRPHRRTLVFLLSYALTIFVLSCFTISILAASHLFILLPLPQLIVAACIVFGMRAAASRLRERRTQLAVVMVAAVLVGGFGALDLRADLRYHDALCRTGGLFAFSDAIYPLADYLDERHYVTPYALDWGIRANVMVLTEGRVTPREIYRQTIEHGLEFDRAAREALREEHPVFISQTEVSSAFPRLERFKQLVAEQGGEPVLERVFTHRDGIPAYYVFTVRKMNSAAASDPAGSISR